MQNVHNPDILIVEDFRADAAEIAQILEQVVSHLSYRIVYSGEEALDFFFATRAFQERNRHELPKFMLIDLGLPQFSGIDLLEVLNAYHRTRDIKKIVITQTLNIQTEQLCQGYGTCSFIQKPVSTKELESALTT